MIIHEEVDIQDHDKFIGMSVHGYMKMKNVREKTVYIESDDDLEEIENYVIGKYGIFEDMDIIKPNCYNFFMGEV